MYKKLLNASLNLVQGLRIELSSPDFQSGAEMTTLAHLAIFYLGSGTLRRLSFFTRQSRWVPKRKTLIYSSPSIVITSLVLVQ